MQSQKKLNLKIKKADKKRMEELIMAKGMNLDEFRTALSSEATVENETLKAELKKLREESSKTIANLKEEAEEYKQMCIALGNRCYIYTDGILCLNCNVDCCPHAYSQSDIAAAVKFMNKNKLPRTDETYRKVITFLNERRNNKR